jgi:hypothetical protein
VTLKTQAMGNIEMDHKEIMWKEQGSVSGCLENCDESKGYEETGNLAEYLLTC